MSRLMPGRVRQEGIELYDKGQLIVEKMEESQIFLRIADEVFLYTLDETNLNCSCSLFIEKGYCPHLAATEYFLKNDAQGKDLLENFKTESAIQTEIKRRSYAGGLFLDKVLGAFSPKEVCYRLAAEGQLGPFDQQIDWTLKISRLPDQRTYIIRDIGAFLKTVQQNGHYQIGKNYYEPLSLEQFDLASQDVIEFLWRVLPDKLLQNDVLVNFGRILRFPLVYFEEGLELLQELFSFQFSFQSQDYTDVVVLPYEANLGFFAFDVTVHTHMIEISIKENHIREILHGYYLIRGNHLYRLTRKEQALLTFVKNLTPSPTVPNVKIVQVDFQDQAKLALVLADLQLLGVVKAPKKFSIRDFQATFHLRQTVDFLQLDMSLNFDGIPVYHQEGLLDLPFTPHYQHLEQVFSTIEQLGFRGQFQARKAPLTAAEIYPFFTEDLPRLQALGRVTLEEQLQGLLVAERPQMVVETSGSLLDISFDFAGIAEDELEAAMTALLAQESYFTSKTGRVLVFDDETKKISRSLQWLRAKHSSKGHLTVGKLASYQLMQTIADVSSVHLSTDFQELAHDLMHPEEYPLPNPTITATLRDYQMLGVKWLSMLDKYGFGGLLADDMGLGKTLQIIAFLSGRLSKHSRVLILAPASLIYNWQEEFQRFSPQLDVAVVYGNKLEREALLAQGHQVVVTSYASFRQDVALYSKEQQYDYLILDEAQVMKNSQTKIAQHLRNFEVGNCFALSGTPIENHLSEIWSIFQIILPGLLPAKTEFGKLSAQEVARLIKPFVLRRKKEDVLLELPDLIEVNVLNELSNGQKAIYLAQLQQMQSSIAGISDAEMNRRKIEILSGITRLRQICDTPKLFMEDYVGNSGKMDSLHDLLLQLKEGNHRVLIFSQFRDMLDLIASDLQDLGISNYQLTGSTPASERQAMTRAFNAGSRDAFLISLKAGGVGLNLTGADTVILVDLWWNPAVEAQAISRAHRMGQLETVEVYRLITRGTIEEKIQELQETKKNLVTTVLDGNESRASMTTEEIKEILGID